MAEKNNKGQAKKETNVISIDEMPSWISTKDVNLIDRQKYAKLLRFYILNTPDKAKSARGKRISDYGIDESEFLEQLKGEINKWTSSGNRVLVKSKFEEADLLDFPPSADYTERVCIAYSNNDELTYFFGHIRNALAHGRFNISGPTKEPVLVLEDRNSYGNCSARMVIKMSRLVGWITQIENKDTTKK